MTNIYRVFTHVETCLSQYITSAEKTSKSNIGVSKPKPFRVQFVDKMYQIRTHVIHQRTLQQTYQVTIFLLHYLIIIGTNQTKRQRELEKSFVLHRTNDITY